MKKTFTLALLIFTMMILAACGRASTTPNTPAPQQEAPQETPTPTPEPPPQPTIQELGETIVAAGMFWNDRWYVRGRFDPQHIGGGELPQHISAARGYGFARLLPTSGFESLNDVRNYLLQYYTESWVDSELFHEFTAFIEYDGDLFVDFTRAGFVRPNWETAAHTLIEQNGRQQIVETTVLVGGWHRADFDPMDYAWEAAIRFTLIDGRIDSPSNYELWGLQAAFAPAYEPDPAPEPQPIPDTVGIPVPFTGTAAIDFASEEDMARHPDAPRYSRIEDSIWMKFSFDVPVRDVVFVGISSYFAENVESWLFEPGELWFEAGDLAAGQPVFVQTYGHFGTLPAQAIGFTYGDGVRYFIPFDQSMMDGSLVLHKRSAFTFDD